MLPPISAENYFQVFVWTIGGSFAANFITFVAWVYRRIRNQQVNESLVREMALKHLPYIYTVLKALCRQSGIEIEEHPNIGFIELNGSGLPKK